MEWLVPLLVLGLAALFVAGIYNRLVALRQNRNNAFADIDVQLKQRYDLVPQLVETVRAYAAHESSVLEGVTAARAGVAQSHNPDQRIAAETKLGSALGGLFAVAENYPELKADQNFRQLMAELSDIENKIAASRRFFNNATSELNTAAQQFPGVLLAGPFGFKAEPFYEDSTTDRATLEKAPTVKF